MKPLPFIFLCFTLLPSVYAQATYDSLRAQIPKTNDSIESNLLYENALALIFKDPTLARTLAEEGLAVAARLKYQKGMAQHNRVIGITHDIQGSYALAIKAFDEGRAHAIAINNLDLIASLNNGLGLAYYHLTQHDKALEYFFLSMEMSEKLNNLRYVGNVYNNLGMLYDELREYDKALLYYKKALTAGKTLKDARLIGSATNNISIVFKYKKQYDSSLHYLNESLRVKEETQDKLGISSSLMNIASIYKRLGDYSKALNYLDRSDALKTALGDQAGLVQSNDTRAEIYIAQKRFAEAEALIKQNEKLLQQTGAKEPKLLVYERYVDLHEAKGDYKQALKWLRIQKQFHDSLFNESKSNQLAELQTLYEVHKKEAEITKLQNERDQQRNQIQVIALLATLGLVVLIGSGIVYMQRQRQKRAILETNQKLAETQLEVTTLRAQELEKELDYKNRELASYTVNFIQKSQLMEELKEAVQEVRTVHTTDNLSAHVHKLNRLIESGGDIDKEWEDFRIRFEQIHPDFFSAIRTRYPDITDYEVKLCALIKLNFSMRESAKIMGISPESVKTARYRLRKKLSLDKDETLSDFVEKMDREL